METIFNFSNDNTEYIYALHPKSKIILHIKPDSDSNTKSFLYFTDGVNNKIDIPSGFIIYKKERKYGKILLPNEINEYILYWAKNYDLVYNGETLCNIRSIKTPSIYNTRNDNKWIIMDNI
jgi:hypothetical protein